MNMPPSVSLVVIHFGLDLALLERLFVSLRAHPDRLFVNEIIVVDNGSYLNQDAHRRLSQIVPIDAVSIISNNCESYASGTNAGVRASTGDLVIISNNDIEWIAGHSIGPLINSFADPRVGVGGPQLRFPNGAWQRSYGAIPSVGRSVTSLLFLDSLARMVRARWRPRGRTCRRVRGYIDGAFMMVRRRCFVEVGGFDETFNFYGEDAEFCCRARKAGWLLLFVPRAEIMHVRGGSSKQTQSLTRARNLVSAETKVVRMRSGGSAARFYNRAMAISYLERMLVYGLLSSISTDARWRARFADARARYFAARAQ